MDDNLTSTPFAARVQDLRDPRSPALNRTPLEYFLEDDMTKEIGNHIPELEDKEGTYSENENVPTSSTDLNSSAMNVSFASAVDTSCDSFRYVSVSDVGNMADDCNHTKDMSVVPFKEESLADDKALEVADEMNSKREFAAFQDSDESLSMKSFCLESPRMPLRDVSVNSPTVSATVAAKRENILHLSSTPTSANSPTSYLRQKHWKRIDEERSKRGLQGDENNMLMPPLFDYPASAPGKLAVSRRRNKKSGRFAPLNF